MATFYVTGSAACAAVAELLNSKICLIQFKLVSLLAGSCILIYLIVRRLNSPRMWLSPHRLWLVPVNPHRLWLVTAKRNSFDTLVIRLCDRSFFIWPGKKSFKWLSMRSTSSKQKLFALLGTQWILAYIYIPCIMSSLGCKPQSMFCSSFFGCEPHDQFLSSLGCEPCDQFLSFLCCKPRDQFLSFLCCEPQIL